METNLNSIMEMKEEFISYIILAFICILLIITIGYIIYIRSLQNRTCSFMESMYSTLNGNIRPINPNDPDCKFNLYDYYVKTAFNACSGGSYKNDFVNLCNLKAVIREGVRGLDFEIYSINNTPVVATSTAKDFYIKETFNSVSFSDVMKTIKDYAFASGSSPNYTDPIIIHLRFMSTNQEMFTNLAKIFESYDGLVLGKEYSFEYSGQNLGSVPLLNFQNKVIIIADRKNTAFLENQDLLEYINMTSSSIFMRAYEYFDVKNNPDINELQEYNRRNMTIVMPDNGSNPVNPSGLLCREAGCQLVAMRYQYTDNFLAENNAFFNEATYAFSLKPERLRYIPVTIPDPVPQKPELSYATRNVTTDYYSFNF